MKNSPKRKFFNAGSMLFGSAFLFFSLHAYAQSPATFNIDKGYDAKERTSIEATLEQTTPHGFFYFEKDYAVGLSENDRSLLSQALQNLSDEFEQTIWPRLTQFYGEVGQGPDGSSSVTVLFHEMGETAGGYFSPVNLYSKTEKPESNGRNIVFLNIKKLPHSIMKALLAHEFQHVISFYRKDKRFRQSEDVWLNELRSEYAPTYLGYDNQYRRSNLEQRVAAFLENPSDSLTEWAGGKYDYGTVNLFGQYVVDRFGIDILQKSMQSSVIGIESIEGALQVLGQGRNFSDVFRDWLVANFLNDCTVVPYDIYCYKNPNLTPRIIKIALSGITQGEQVNIVPGVKSWSGNWYEFTANELKPQKLKFSFSSSDPNASFRIPYVLKRRGMPIEVHEFSLVNQKLETQFENFGNDIFGLAVFPFQQGKRQNFSATEPVVPFELNVGIVQEQGVGEQDIITPLVTSVAPPSNAEVKKMQEDQIFIEQLQKQIVELEGQLLLLLQKKNEEAAQRFSYAWKRDLFAGLKSDKDVEALQSALQDQRVYNGPVTGNFFGQTLEAVKKFQEKYGLPQAGRVGPQTRAKLNEIYGK